MGGDLAPEAALTAARYFDQDDVELLLVGSREAVAGAGLPYVVSTEVVTMEDKPARIHREKPDSSMRLAIQQVADGNAAAAISAGNTGALLSIGLFTLGRLPGIDRPALGGVFPTRSGGRTLLVDAGANADVKPRYLLQFACMGSVYMERVFGVDRPRVGLLNVGAEEGKGSQLVQEAFALLRASRLNFAGNVEGNDVPAGAVDVVVCDGFTGNIVAKVSEGVAGMVGAWVREEIRRDKLAPLGALLLRGAFKRVRGRLAIADIGGCAPLFGLNGLVVKAHGRSDAAAIRYALELAARSAREQLVERMRESLAAEPSLRSARSPE